MTQDLLRYYSTAHSAAALWLLLVMRTYLLPPDLVRSLSLIAERDHIPSSLSSLSLSLSRSHSCPCHLFVTLSTHCPLSHLPSPLHATTWPPGLPPPKPSSSHASDPGSNTLPSLRLPSATAQQLQPSRARDPRPTLSAVLAVPSSALSLSQDAFLAYQTNAVRPSRALTSVTCAAPHLPVLASLLSLARHTLSTTLICHCCALRPTRSASIYLPTALQHNQTSLSLSQHKC